MLYGLLMFTWLNKLIFYLLPWWFSDRLLCLRVFGFIPGLDQMFVESAYFSLLVWVFCLMYNIYIYIYVYLFARKVQYKVKYILLDNLAVIEQAQFSVKLDGGLCQMSK